MGLARGQGSFDSPNPLHQTLAFPWKEGSTQKKKVLTPTEPLSEVGLFPSWVIPLFWQKLLSVRGMVAWYAGTGLECMEESDQVNESRMLP